MENTETQKEAVLREISRDIQHLGQSEYALAYERAQLEGDRTIAITRRVEIELAKLREPYFKTRSTWLDQGATRAAAAESDRAARAELLKRSEALAQLSDLEKRALHAKQAAEAKEAELNAAWDSFCDLPSKAERLSNAIANINAEIASLDQAKLTAEYKTLFKAIRSGASANPAALDVITNAVVMNNLRLEVLTELRAENESNLTVLRSDNSRLAKLLGRAKHRI